MADSEMWKPDEVRNEREDVEKVIRQCRELGDVGSAVYWSGYARALEVVLNGNGEKKSGVV